MTRPQHGPWDALPPGTLPEVVALLSSALDATLADARRLQRLARNPHIEPARCVEAARVDAALILFRLAQASANLAAVPGVWQLLHGEHADPPPPDWADLLHSLPGVLDLDAASNARRRTEAAQAEAGR